MAVVIADLRQHLEGQLTAKKNALNETEESLRSETEIFHMEMPTAMMVDCNDCQHSKTMSLGGMWETERWRGRGVLGQAGGGVAHT